MPQRRARWAWARCDLGKEKVPSQIRLKKTPWTAAERNFYQMHVAYGLEMLQQLPDISAAA